MVVSAREAKICKTLARLVTSWCMLYKLIMFNSVTALWLRSGYRDKNPWFGLGKDDDLG